tara:strand:+ start:446 stop:1180 length:735 start_codon:yes stop_codon:yes gene_type:complete
MAAASAVAETTFQLFIDHDDPVPLVVIVVVPTKTAHHILNSATRVAVHRGVDHYTLVGEALSEEMGAAPALLDLLPKETRIRDLCEGGDDKVDFVLFVENKDLGFEGFADAFDAFGYELAPPPRPEGVPKGSFRHWERIKPVQGADVTPVDDGRDAIPQDARLFSALVIDNNSPMEASIYEVGDCDLVTEGTHLLDLQCPTIVLNALFFAKEKVPALDRFQVPRRRLLAPGSAVSMVIFIEGDE